MNVGVHSSRKYGAVAIIFIFLSLSVLSAQHVGTAATQTAGLLVPLYTYPTDPSWQALIQAKLANPSVPIAAIINPSGGPGYGQDPNFVQGINSLRSAGITVLGYVATAYGSVSVSSIETQINEYKQWYNVNGIMFDEMYNIPGYESYYSTLSNYAYSVGFSWTVGNPGAPVPSSYIGTMGTIIIYENAGLPSTSFLASATGGYPTSNFAFTAYGVSLPSQSYISSAESYVSWMYITDGVYPNPYTGLPSYLYSLLAEMNTGSVSTITGSGTVPITVQSVDQNGAAINGLYTVVQSSSGSTVATGFTPMTFYATAGQQYTITVSNYGSYYFSQWSTGSTSNSITITPTQGTTLTAEYSSSVQSPPVLTIESQYTSGTPITGLYTVVESSSGSVLSTGFTTFSYTGTAGSTYTIAVDDYGTHHFIQWSNGSTNRLLTLSLGQSTTLIAYFT